MSDDWGPELDDMVGEDPDSWDEDELARQAADWEAREAELFPLGIAAIAKYNRWHDARGRFSSGGGGHAAPMTGPGQPPAPIAGEEAVAAVRHRTRMAGGFTISRSSGAPATQGYAVAVAPTRGLVLEPSELGMAPAKVRNWIKANEKLFAEPDTYMGGWLDKENRKVALDIVKVFPPNREGRRKAVKVGRDNDQVAIFSIHEGKEIPTGGTGGYVGKADKPKVSLLSPDASDDEIAVWLQGIANDEE